LFKSRHHSAKKIALFLMESVMKSLEGKKLGGKRNNYQKLLKKQGARSGCVPHRLTYGFFFSTQRFQCQSRAPCTVNKNTYSLTFINERDVK